ADLAHVEPADLMPDTIGHGAAESELPEAGTAAQRPQVAAEVAAMMQRVASNGYVRNKLTVLHGGKRSAVATATVDAGAAEMPLFAGALAMTAPVAGEIATLAADPRAEQIRQARIKGYEGDNCGECGNFTLVRNGTCLKCDTCGATSGCS
ncbi:MAG TPA: vitamin B12-dependent ribonucleotide reductase, partial [Stellaceae bacterium]|nr:vitamin B12-dependent ribonucleotide reductase [Stellaceae bacterium]